MSLYILFSFNDVAATAISFGVLAVIGYWVAYRRKQLMPAEPEVIEIDSALGAPIIDAPLGKMS